MIRICLLAMLVGAAACAEAARGQAPPSKVGVVNMAKVFAKYEKAVALRKEQERVLRPLRQEVDAVKAEIAELAKQLDTPNLDPALAKDGQERLGERKKHLEQLTLRAREGFLKRSEEQLAELWKEISVAVRQQADAGSFTLVLAYGDPPENEASLLALPQRRIQAMDAGGLTALFIHSSIDLTDAVIEKVNRDLRHPRQPLAAGLSLNDAIDPAVTATVVDALRGAWQRMLAEQEARAARP